jgi:chromosome segregation ATPase
MSERVAQLESELTELKRRRLISDDSSTDTITTLTHSLEKTTSELARERELHYSLQLSASLVKDENIQMTRRLEHLVRSGEEEQDDRESAVRKLREATATVASLKERVSAVEAEREQLQQALSVCRVRLRESEEARWQAVESAQHTDLRWREIEVLTYM